jgi:hypothetical protein
MFDLVKPYVIKLARAFFDDTGFIDKIKSIIIVGYCVL